MKTLIFALFLLTSLNVYATGFAGHWQGPDSATLTCKNNYQTTCSVNFKAGYDPVKSESDFKMRTQIDCNTPDRLSFSFGGENAVTLEGETIVSKLEGGEWGEECGSIEEGLMSIACSHLIQIKSSDPYAVELPFVERMAFLIGDENHLVMTIPVNLYNVSCRIDASVPPVFP